MDKLDGKLIFFIIVMVLFVCYKFIVFANWIKTRMGWNALKVVLIPIKLMPLSSHLSL